jgi:hypothetical protein
MRFYHRRGVKPWLGGYSHFAGVVQPVWTDLRVTGNLLRWAYSIRKAVYGISFLNIIDCLLGK